MSSPLISIIIPAYNAENSIAYCIDSVCLAIGNRQNVEIIIVNDGSTDKTEQIIRNKISQTHQNRAIELFSKGNGGVSTARNMGLNNASGKWIMFVDADDQLDASTFDYIFPLLDNTSDKNPVLYVFSYETFNTSSGHITYLKDKLIDIRTVLSDNSFATVMDTILCTCWNKTYRNDIIRSHNIKFPEGIKVGEDFIFNSQYLQFIKHLKLLPEVLYIYNNSGESAIGKFYPDYDCYIQKMSSAYLKLIKALDISSQIAQPIYDRFILNRWLYATELCINSKLPIKCIASVLDRWYKGIDIKLLHEIAENNSSQYNIIAKNILSGKSLYPCIVRLMALRLWSRIKSNLYRLKSELSKS